MTRSSRLLSAGVTAALVLSLVPQAATAVPVTVTALRPLAADRPMTTGRVLVRYRDGVTTATRRSAAVAGGATSRAQAGPPGVELLTTPDTDRTVAALHAHDEVVWAEPETLRYRSEATTAAQAELRVPAAWTAEPRMRAAGTEVAVIDDGVSATNPDLTGKVVDGGDCSSGTCAATGGTTTAGNHGTAVAALVAGTEDGYGVAGVAPDATVVAYRVFASGSTGASTTAVAAAIRKAATRPAVKSINLSLGSPFFSRVEQDAITEVRAARPDLVIVAAAGNDGGERANYPAGLDGVLSVGAAQAVSGGWAPASFSTRGDVDVIAPGVAVTSWWGGSLAALDGTSFAAPQVAAIVAGLATTGVTGDRARAAVIASAETQTTTSIPATASGAGRADALAAVTLATGPDAYAALTITGGNSVAATVGRRSVEELRFEPGTTVAAPAPIVATLGTAGAPVAQRTTAVEAGSLGNTGLTAPAGSLVRAFAPYTAPAAGTTGTLTVPAGGTGRPLPLRLTVAANGPEGTAARDNAQITSTLSWGTQSMSVQTVLLPAGAVVLLDVATPAGGGIALWAPSVAGGTAGALGMFDDGWSGTGRATYTTPRAGRYAFGPLSFDATGNGIYKLTASWTPRSTLNRPQFPTFNPLKDGYRDTDELTFKPDRRLTKAQVDVFDSKGRRVWIGYTGAVAAGAIGKVRFGGYTGAGTRRPAGRYTYSITMTTPSGLRGTTNRTAFNLSWARR